MNNDIIVGLLVELCYPLDGAVDLVFVRRGRVWTHICNHSLSAARCHNYGRTGLDSMIGNVRLNVY